MSANHIYCVHHGVIYFVSPACGLCGWINTVHHSVPGAKEYLSFFFYQLKEGISNDRIGYVILRREKVVEMLEKL